MRVCVCACVGSYNIIRKCVSELFDVTPRLPALSFERNAEIVQHCVCVCVSVNSARKLPLVSTPSEINAFGAFGAVFVT